MGSFSFRLAIAWASVFVVSMVQAFPPYLAAWQAKYTTSTLDERMTVLTGTNCNTCHHPPNRGDFGNCYRGDISVLLGLGRSITQALDELDAVDSDGDGVPNGVEITTPRADQPGQVGYSMGLIGATGTDPCAADPDEVVTGQPETPPVVAIPTVSEWGVVITVLLMLCSGTIVLLRPAQPRAAVVA